MANRVPARSRGRQAGAAGVGVDAAGGPVIDPTENVIALNEAANKRQDDLREITNRHLDAKITAVEQIATLRAEHAREIRGLESDRLDKIRQVDVLAGNTAADRALIAIQTLAATTTANAETLRAMVANTATTIATQTAAAMAAVTERIGALEKSSYTGLGKSAYVDPQLSELLAEVKTLRASAAVGAGKTEGIGASWGVIVAVVAVVAALVGVGVSLTRSSTPPQVIYVPAPAGSLLPTTPPATPPR
jgi:hypothetical protein